MFRHTLAFILNAPYAPITFHDPFAPAVATTSEVQTEEDALNNHSTASQERIERQHRPEDEDAEIAINEGIYSDLDTPTLALREHVNKDLEDGASVGCYATIDLADQQGAPSATTQAAAPDDEDDDYEDVFYDAQDSDASPLNGDCEAQAPTSLPDSSLQCHYDGTYYIKTREGWVPIGSRGDQRSSEGQLGSPHENYYAVQLSPSHANNFPRRHNNVTYYIETAEYQVLINGGGNQRTCEEDLNSCMTSSEMLSATESDWELSPISDSNSDNANTNTDTTDDESDTGILPVLFALENKTRNTTKAVSARHFVMRDPLNYGSDEPLSGDLGSDGELADDEDDTDDTLDPESEVEDHHNMSQHADNSEGEEEDDAPSTPQWDPSTFVYVGELTFPEQWPLLPLPMNETNYPEEELADDEKNPQPKSSSVEGNEDIMEEIEDLKEDIENLKGDIKDLKDNLKDLKEDIEDLKVNIENLTEEIKVEGKSEGKTGVSPPASAPELGTAPPKRMHEVKHLLEYRFRELARREARGHGDVSNDVQEVRGKKRGSDDEDEEDDRAQKVQRRS